MRVLHPFQTTELTSGQGPSALGRKKCMIYSVIKHDIVAQDARLIVTSSTMDFGGKRAFFSCLTFNFIPYQNGWGWNLLIHLPPRQ